MWFKNVQLFNLVEPITYTPGSLAKQLEKTAFTPCIPTLPSSAGWVSPAEEDYAPLVHAANGCMMICLQVEDKILPASVVTQELKEKVKEIESEQKRKVPSKEKYTIKDAIYNSMLPRAFTKKSKVYAYFDTNNHWLVINTVSAAKTELFLNVLKKALPNVGTTRPNLKDLSKVMSQWLLNDAQPKSMGIDKSCVLKGFDRQGRVIRCQQQDLTAKAILSLLKDDCGVSQLALSWHDQILFKLGDDFSLKSLKYQDAVLELAREDAESRQEKFNADFIIMSQTLSALLAELVKVLLKN